MKNVVIIGAPRSGKSTLARKLFQKCPYYSLISSDHLRSAFMHVMPEEEINDKGGIGTKTKYPYFIKHLLDRNSYKRKYNMDMYYIIEGDFSYFEQATQLFNNEDTILIFMGKAELTKEELLKTIRKYDTDPKVWTKRFNDEELIKQCEDFLKMSKHNKEMCEKYGYIYIDTSYDYEQKIDKVVEDILNGQQISR